MGRLDDIRETMRLVLAPNELSDTFQYRKLTSKPSAEPRTYDEWYDIVGLPSQGKTSQIFDEKKGVYKNYSNMSFRTADTEPSLEPGDQVMETTGRVWNVIGVLSSGPGSIAYSLGREIGVMASRDRKGGV